MANSENSIYLPLEGVASEHCAVIVDKGLDAVPGILAHKVELNNQRAAIKVKSPEVITAAVNTIRDLGYGVTSIRQSFPVLGMTCASCAISVESILATVPGVTKANVNFATAIVQVDFVPGVVKPEDLRQAIQSIGYDLVISEAAINIDEHHQHQLRKLTQKTYWSLGLSLPVVMIGMFWMDMPWANEIMWLLSTIVLGVFGSDFYINAWKQARHRSANMDTLVALSTGVAYVFSVFNMLFPEIWHARGLHAHVYFEAATVIIAFILLGKWLEEKAKGKTSAAIKKLMGLQPREVTVVQPNGEWKVLQIDQVVPGDLLILRPGEQVAVDGIVVQGNSYVDESMLSGEPIALVKQEGDNLYAGTINQKGSLQYRAEKVGHETMLAHIIRTVQDAQGSKAPVQKLVDRIAAVFVPVVIGIAILAFFAWWIWGGENGITHGLLALITVLVIACPCALGLATPTAIMVGVGKGADKGILIKDAESLERAKKVTAVVLDKTGTITQGRPAVINAFWKSEDPVDQQVLYAMERHSEHPLAAAIIESLPGLEDLALTSFQSITGKGVRASFNGERFLVGSRRLMEEELVSVSADVQERADAWSADANTVVWFSNHREVLAVIAIADPIKPTSAEAVRQLHAKGIDVYMLTGDQEITARSIAEKTGIHHFRAEVLPEQKAAFIKALQDEGKVVAMVGDGINDSTALAQADVSIAMGQGSDIAMDVAKMTILSSDLSRIPEAIKLSKATVVTIRQNLFWAFIYNLIGIPIAAGILFPFTGFLLNPMIAGAAMALSSVSVVTNSLRLKWSR